MQAAILPLWSEISPLPWIYSAITTRRPIVTMQQAFFLFRLWEANIKQRRAWHVTFIFINTILIDILILKNRICTDSTLNFSSGIQQKFHKDCQSEERKTYDTFGTNVFYAKVWMKDLYYKIFSTHKDLINIIKK